MNAVPGAQPFQLAACVAVCLAGWLAQLCECNPGSWPVNVLFVYLFKVLKLFVWGFKARLGFRVV